MGFYCGCGTRNSKLRWLAATLLTLAAIACLVAFIGLIASCASEIDEAKKNDPNDPCVQALENNTFNNGSVDDVCNGRFPSCENAGYPFWVFIVFLVLATIPCYAMCCCATSPKNKKQHEQQGTAVAQPVGYSAAPAQYGHSEAPHNNGGSQYGTAAPPPYGTAAAPAYNAPGYEAGGKPLAYGYQPTV